MNAKLISAVLGAVALAAPALARADEPAKTDAPPAKPAKAKKSKKAKAAKGGEKSCGGDKKGGDKSCGGDKK